MHDAAGDDGDGDINAQRPRRRRRSRREAAVGCAALRLRLKARRLLAQHAHARLQGTHRALHIRISRARLGVARARGVDRVGAAARHEARELFAQPPLLASQHRHLQPLALGLQGVGEGEGEGVGEGKSERESERERERARERASELVSNMRALAPKPGS